MTPHMAGECVCGALAEPVQLSADALQAQLDDLRRHHDRVVKQRNKDWDALMVEIALAVGTEDDREAAECGEVEEFDPWAALRRHVAERDSLRTRVAEIEQEADRLRDVVRHDGEQIVEWKRSHSELCAESQALRFRVADLEQQRLLWKVLGPDADERDALYADIRRLKSRVAELEKERDTMALTAEEREGHWDEVVAERDAMREVYAVAAGLRTYPVPFDDHLRLVDAVDAYRAQLGGEK